MSCVTSKQTNDL